jgi:hypothetical protein
LSASEGNPKLKPSTLHKLSLEYLWDSDMVSLQTNLTYKYLHNDINFESNLDEQNVLVSRPNNISGKNSFSFFVNTSLDFDFVYIDASIEPYYEFFNNKNDHRKNFNFDTEVSVEFYIPYDFEIDINFFYDGKRITSQGFIKYSPFLDIQIKKNFFKGKMTLGIGYSFFPDKTTTIIKQPNVYQYQQEKCRDNAFNIFFRYFFNKGKEYSSEQIEKYMESDRKR